MWLSSPLELVIISVTVWIGMEEGGAGHDFYLLEHMISNGKIKSSISGAQETIR